MSYSLNQWLLFFFIYCMVGWVFESTYVSIKKRKLTNRGFMRGPFLPIYGSGAIVMLFVGLPLKEHPVCMFFAGLLAASSLEYVTGAAMEKIFRVKYWDYSDCFLNLNGHICFKASMAWGTFTLILNYFLHMPVERFVFMISSEALQVIVVIIQVYFVADFSLAFKTALDLRDVIIALEKFRDELDRMEKRIDVAIAFAQDSREQTLEELAAKLEESRQRLEENRENAKHRLEERMDIIEERIEIAKEKLASMEVIAELEGKHDELRERREELQNSITEMRVANALMRNRIRESAKRRGMLYRNMIRNNILATGKFKDSLDEIRNMVDEFKKDR